MEKTIAHARYKPRKNKLPKEQDKFVAKTIDETLIACTAEFHGLCPWVNENS
jgi:hypothetical protein